MLKPLSNVVIDFSNVTLVMGDRTATAVHVSNWQHVTLMGLTVAYVHTHAGIACRHRRHAAAAAAVAAASC
jgi:hypothetical protein